MTRIRIKSRVFNSSFRHLLNCDKRYLVLYGGAGSGKSYFIGERYFAVLGLRGVGKSSLINTLSDTESFDIANDGKICTQEIKLVTFVFNNHRFNAIILLD